MSDEIRSTTCSYCSTGCNLNISGEINPVDAEGLGIEHGKTISVSSERGEVNAVVSVVEGVAKSQLFMPMHYEQTNRLTFSSFDSESFQSVL